MPKTVILVNRSPESLSKAELREIKENFGDGANLVRTDPKNAKEHLGDCKRLKADGVILPEEPFWRKAHDAGFRHGAFRTTSSGFTAIRIVYDQPLDFRLGNLSFKKWPDYTPLAYYNN